VNRLIRVAYGPFVLGDLPPGEAGEVRQHDLVAFRQSMKGTRKESPIISVSAPRARDATPATDAPPSPSRAGDGKPPRVRRGEARREASGASPDRALPPPRGKTPERDAPTHNGKPPRSRRGQARTDAPSSAPDRTARPSQRKAPAGTRSTPRSERDGAERGTRNAARTPDAKTARPQRGETPPSPRPSRPASGRPGKPAGRRPRPSGPGGRR
jgi:23S rRNA pseudouridine2605 synthase